MGGKASSIHSCSAAYPGLGNGSSGSPDHPRNETQYMMFRFTTAPQTSWMCSKYLLMPEPALSPLQMLSSTLSPATLRRNLLSASCIRSYSNGQYRSSGPLVRVDIKILEVNLCYELTPVPVIHQPLKLTSTCLHLFNFSPQVLLTLCPQSEPSSGDVIVSGPLSRRVP